MPVPLFQKLDSSGSRGIYSIGLLLVQIIDEA